MAERINKDKIIQAISENTDDLLKQKIDLSALKQNLAFKVLSRQMTLQNIVDCAVIGIAIYLREHEDNGKNT